MHQDIWHHVIEFSHPIDVFASLIGVNRSIYQLVEKSIVELDQILKCDENCFGCKISISNFNEKDDELLMKENKIKLLGNSKYFIRMYLLHLAFRLRDLNPDDKDSYFHQIIDGNELKLLNFYRDSLLNRTKAVKLYYIDDYIINKLIILGDGQVGKKTFSNTMRDGRFYDFHQLVMDFIVKRFKITGEQDVKHHIFDTAHQERYLSADVLVKRFERGRDVQFLFCFSMKKRESLDGLEKWFTSVDENRLVSPLGIIVGLYPYAEVTEMVNPIDAVKKAYQYGKSVFAQVNSREMKNVYLPFWFIHLQFIYFQNPLRVPEKIAPTKSESSGNCNLM